MIVPPNILPVLGKGLHDYQVAQDWRCYGLVVPAGFMCDGASIPRILWVFRPPDGLHRAGDVWHDWGYANRGRRYPYPDLSRAQVDRGFREIMILSGVKPWVAWIMWAAVRVGGWLPWRRSSGVPRVEPLVYSVS